MAPSLVSPSLWHLSGLLLLLQLSPGWCGCRRGTQEECMEAPFVPGHDLVGEGFDIVKMQPKRAYTIDVHTYLADDNTCLLCENDEMDNKLQKVPVVVVDWRADSDCDRTLSSSIFYSATELMKHSGQQVTNDWKVGLGLEKLNIGPELQLGMSKSEMASFALKRAQSDHYTFISHELKCHHYSFRISSQARLSNEFSDDISRLPREYTEKTKPQYTQLINVYGTHFMNKVGLGGKTSTVTAIRTCSTVSQSRTEDEIKDCLTARLSVSIGELLKASPGAESCGSLLNSEDKTDSSSSENINQVTETVPAGVWQGGLSSCLNDSTGFNMWFDSLKTDPGLVSYSLNPLTELVTDKVVKGNLMKAIQEYLEENAVQDKCNVDCKSGKCCQKTTHQGKLQISLKASNLDGDWWSRTDAYAKVEYGGITRKTEQRYSDNPEWNTLDFGEVSTSNHLLRVQVYDDDWWRQELLGTCDVQVSSGKDTKTCRFGRSSVTVSYTLTCAEMLTGNQCQEYNHCTK